MASPASVILPPEGARATTHRSETATAADHRRPESIATTETAGTAGTAAAGITKIRVEVETDRRVTDTETKGIEDIVGTTTTKARGRLREQLFLFLKKRN